MSQAESQDSLARLQSTIAELQAIATSLAEQNITLSEDVLTDLVTDTAKLAATLTTQNTSQQPATSTSAADEWDSDIFEDSIPATPTPTRQPNTTTPSRVSQTQSIKRRKSRPWWQDQKIFIGAVSAAIAFIFIWQFTTKTPEVTLEATQPNDNTTPTETVLPDIDQPSAELKTKRSPIEQIEPQPIPEPTPEPEPEPIRPLTPEQRLVAAIQSQIDDVTQPYGDNIVRAVEADFDNSMLRITVGDAWYLLKERLQDRLGSDVLELSQILDFKKLRVEDLEGHFVARNPVIGDALVIVRRYQDFQETETDLK
ncbi:hypothetical protein Lepto7376_1582 [[Leptolyngbya] sp. PCC 7376]|uniref:hypothetical protein n=1 Tax=[Leptolyngbya] sp. PCC 7376 TaxID=111781 RepID=UPI00029F3283|nr:hypothetical protein [[Leptolyngbya] sp. PCC 7376]AFY37919.1 hypothetical protein Lepto7376_1582 [[Leptolyngbya] sp. PCC 7376]